MDNFILIIAAIIIIAVIVDWYNGWKLASKLTSIEEAIGKDDLKNLLNSISDIKSKVDEIKSNGTDYNETVNDIKDLITEIQELKENIEKISSDLASLKETKSIEDNSIKEDSSK